MILRRVIQHLLKQEWTAIGIDFLIVVVGVFVGLQANSWNEEKSARHEYELALERHRAEASANLDDMRALVTTSEERIEIVRAGLDALLTCEDSAENRRAVEAALGPASGTLGVAVRMTALNELTATPTLLAQQSEAERHLFSTLRYQIEFLLREADFLERLPLMERLADNPRLRLGPREQVSTADYFTSTTGVGVHSLILAEPIDVACHDDALIKDIYNWERWQSYVPRVAYTLQALYESNLKSLKR
jgi:hypothetical protein